MVQFRKYRDIFYCNRGLCTIKPKLMRVEEEGAEVRRGEEAEAILRERERLSEYSFDSLPLFSCTLR